MKRLCTICARGGSKGVPHKNIREISGKPLMAHSIAQAKESGLFDCVAVSSDSKDVLDIAKEWGADVLIHRPSELSQDSSPKIPVIQHCVREVEKEKAIIFDTVVDLDVTSPLRNTEDIAECIKLLEKNNITNVITGSPSRRSPYFNLVERSPEGGVYPSKMTGTQILRRQDSPPCFDLNASIYAWKRKGFDEINSVFNQDTLLHQMPEDRSLDIDTELDFKIVSFLMEQKNV